MTKFGKFMYNLITPAAIYLSKHKALFYALSYTWGILTTLGGWVMFLFVKLFLRKKIEWEGKFHTADCIVFGNNWGGLECGTNILVAGNAGEDWELHTKRHELGHTYQNAVMGPFAIFMGFIPSVARYWYQTIRDHKKLPNKPYDDFWYEGSATYIGTVIDSEK